MKRKKYTEQFKDEAVRMVRDRNYSVAEVSKRLGVTSHSLYNWLKGKRALNKVKKEADLELENIQLKKELKRVEEERDILKKAAAYLLEDSK